MHSHVVRSKESDKDVVWFRRFTQPLWDRGGVKDLYMTKTEAYKLHYSPFGGVFPSIHPPSPTQFWAFGGSIDLDTSLSISPLATYRLQHPSIYM